MRALFSADSSAKKPPNYYDRLFAYVSAKGESFRELLLFVLVGCAGVLAFHRATLLSGLDIVQSDTADSRLIIFLLEHWHRVFAGNAGWASPSMFYPLQGILGHSDMLSGMGVLFSGFRTLGLDLFQAANATLVLLSILSYLSAYWLLRRVLKIGCMGSVVGAAFFAFSYPKFAQLPHLQLRFDFFQPLALGMIVPLWLETGAMRTREIAGRLTAFGLLVSLGANTTFYHTWFFVFFVCTSGGVALAFPVLRTRLAARLREGWRGLWIPISICGLALLPFLSLYLPKLKPSAERNWQNTIPYIPHISDYFWVGPEHLLWGTLQFNSAAGVFGAIEHRLGIGFAASVVLLLGWMWGVWHLIAALRGRSQARTGREDLFAAILVGSLVVTALTVRWGSFYPWQVIYQLVPGASAMIAVGRWAITLMLPVSVLFAVGADWIQDALKERARLGKGIIVVVGLLVGLEQAGRIPASYSAEVATRYHEELVRAIPDTCQAFLLAPPPQPEDAFISRERFDEAGYLASNPDVARSWRGSAWDHYRQFGYREGRSFNASAAATRQIENFHYQVSAMIASAMSGKPTVNGASGFMPAGYPLSNLYATDVSQRLAAWLSTSCLVSKRLSASDLSAPSRHSLSLGFRPPPVSDSIPLAPGITQSMPSGASGIVYFVDSMGPAANPFSRKTIQLKASESFGVAGWAIDRPNNSPASGVELVLDRKTYRITYGMPRADVADSLKEPAYAKSGFVAAFPASLVGSGEHVVSIRFIAADHSSYFETPELAVGIR